ncbi:MAG: DUF2071 domain-containing protein [Chitinophagaceae bacterium]
MTEKVLPRKIFLSARWEHLIMLNYEVPPEILEPFIPPYTELDLFEGKVIVSVVGFLFNHTKVLGIKWPFHTNFEEVNLRLYVKHFDGKIWKRGVAFISEIVPRHIIAWMANGLYNEHYKAMPTRHQRLETTTGVQVSYDWKFKDKWNSLSVAAENAPVLIQSGTEEEFIFEHYWGYNELNPKTTIEYGVEHPRWKVYPVTSFEASYDIENLYGQAFVPYLSVQPNSVFLAKGSRVIVRKPRFIRG